MGNRISSAGTAEYMIRPNTELNRVAVAANEASPSPRTPLGVGGEYRPWRPSVAGRVDVRLGDWGWWSSMTKPSGFVDYREQIAGLPLAYQPVDGFNLAVRRGCELDDIVRRVFLEVGPEELSDSGLKAVFLSGLHPERLAPLLTLVDLSLLNARHDHAVEIELPNVGPLKTSMNLLHLMACLGVEPGPGQPGVSLADRFQGLRRSQVSLGVRNRDGLAPLHFAAMCDNTEALQALLRCRVNINVQCKVGLTPLMLAVKHGSMGALRVLLAAGANTNLRSLKDQFAPLHFAVLRGGRDGQQAAQELMRAGADPLAQSVIGRTPLHIATQHDDAVMLDIMLAGRGGTGREVVRPNIANRKGETPLHVAAALDRPQIVNLLLAHGAHPNLRDQRGRRVLATAQAGGASQAVIDALLTSGAY